MKYANTIFPIHYWKKNIPNNDELKERYLSRIVDTYQNEHIGSPSEWITEKMHTSFDNIHLNNQVFGEDLPIEVYGPHINDFFDYPWNGMFQDFWFNCYIDGDWQEQHCHVSERQMMKPHLSFIHYLSFDPERHQPVTFVDPSRGVRCASFELECTKYDAAYRPDIQEGDLLMFPSYLEHYVKRSQPTPDYPRVTISFNMHLTEY